MNKIICFSTVDYSWMHQRPQQLMRGLSERGWKVIYCNKTQLEERYLEEISENLTICHNINELIKDNIVADIVWVINPKQIYLKGVFKEKLFIYDCVDDFPLLRNPHYKMIKEADIVLCTSKPLFKDIEKYRKDVQLVPNACDFQHFNHPDTKALAIYPKEYDKIIGYIGALAPWVDYRLIDLIAATFPKHLILLVGAALGNVKIPQRSNIKYVGHQSYNNIPMYLKAMDVTMIPFKKNTITYSTNPIKLYEYLAQGKPVVSTYLPEVIPFSKYIYISRSHRDFLSNISKASTEKDVEVLTQRKNIAQLNSWHKRLDAIEKCIKNYNK